MKILERNYDVTVDKIKGINKLDPDQLKDIEKGKLSRFIAVMDETGYTINAEGEPEMTEAAQVEYDGFVSRIRQKLLGTEMQIVDEGYGVDENELEWHVTACVMDETNSVIAGIIEIDTCVKTDEDNVF